MKLKTTPEQSKETLKALDELTQGAGKVLFDRATKLYASLADDERQRFNVGGTQFYRAARIVMLACVDEIEGQYSAEATRILMRAA